MTWQEGLFFDAEDPREITDDSMRCPWCLKCLDATRMSSETLPETQIMEGVLRMKSHGRRLDEALHFVRIAWEHEAEG